MDLMWDHPASLYLTHGRGGQEEAREGRGVWLRGGAVCVWGGVSLPPACWVHVWHWLLAQLVRPDSTPTALLLPVLQVLVICHARGRGGAARERGAGRG